MTTTQRDLANLRHTEKYLPHPDDNCQECAAMKEWLAKTTKELERKTQ